MRNLIDQRKHFITKIAIHSFGAAITNRTPTKRAVFIIILTFTIWINFVTIFSHNCFIFLYVDKNDSYGRLNPKSQLFLVNIGKPWLNNSFAPKKHIDKDGTERSTMVDAGWI